MTHLLRNVRWIDPLQNRDETVDLVWSGDTVQAIVPRWSKPVDQEFDAATLVCVPGLLDMHVHLREPGQEEKETIATGCASAARAGFTTVACMPNTRPVNDNLEVTRFIQEQSRQACGVDVLVVAALSRGLQSEELTDMEALKQAGVVAFSDDGRCLERSDLLGEALRRCHHLDVPLIEHAEDHRLSAGGSVHQGSRSRELGIPGIPASSEEVAVARDILIQQETGGHLHLTHLSTAVSLEMVRQAKKRGQRITCDVTPHHLLLTDDDLSLERTELKVNPPLRPETDRLALIEGLRDGTVDAIATDHAPHTAAEKARPFSEAPFGLVGMETAVPAAGPSGSPRPDQPLTPRSPPWARPCRHTPAAGPGHTPPRRSRHPDTA